MFVSWAGWQRIEYWFSGHDGMYPNSIAYFLFYQPGGGKKAINESTTGFSWWFRMQCAELNCSASFYVFLMLGSGDDVECLFLRPSLMPHQLSRDVTWVTMLRLVSSWALEGIWYLNNYFCPTVRSIDDGSAATNLKRNSGRSEIETEIRLFFRGLYVRAVHVKGTASILRLADVSGRESVGAKKMLFIRTLQSLATHYSSIIYQPILCVLLCI